MGRILSLRNRALLMVGISLLSLLSLFTPLFSPNVSAVTTGDIRKKADVWVMLSGIVTWPEDLERSVSVSDANSCKFIEDDNSIHGPGLTNDNLSSIGMNCVEIMKAIGYKPPSGSQSNYTIADRYGSNEVLDAYQKAGISSAEMFFGGNLRTGEPSNAIGYAIASKLLKEKCSVSYRTEFIEPTPPYNQDSAHNQRVDWIKEGGTRNTPLNNDSADNATDYLFWMWTYENGKASKNIYHAGSSMDDYFDVGSGAKFLVDYQSGPRDADQPWQVDCYQAGRLLQDNDGKYAKGYAAVLKPGSDQTPGTCEDRYGPGAEMDACVQGYVNKIDPNFCKNTFDGAQEAACEWGRTKATGTTGITAPPVETVESAIDKTTCVIEGVGWIICPVVNLLANITDGAYKLVENLLVVEPLPLTTGQNTGIFGAWSIMRNFANIAFVIFFLVIIFSQLTSVGISNYGIKKLLPKLVIAAILVNVSYWICAVAVDLSNILGGSLKTLLDNVQIDAGVETQFTSWAETSSGLLGGTLFGVAAGTAIFFTTLSVLLPMLVVVLATIVTVFLALVLRQVLVILLVAISPIAFVAYLLPNTESFTKGWWGASRVVLVVYPVVAVVFGGAGLASTIIMTSAPDTWYIQIAGASAAVIPLIAVPALISGVNKIASRFGLPNVGVKLGGLQKSAEGFRDKRKDIAAERRFGRAQRVLKGTGSMLGEEGTRRRRTAAWLRGSGASATLNREQREANAKRALAEAKQDYVVGRAGSTGPAGEAYARSIAGPTGDASKIIASAKEAKIKELNAEITAEKATMSRIGALDNPTTGAPGLISIMRNTSGKETEIRRAAAAGQLMHSGSDTQIQEALNYAAGYTKDPSTGAWTARTGMTKDETDALTTLQQQIHSDIGSRKPISLGAADIEDLRTGTYGGLFDEKVEGRLIKGKQSAAKLAGATADELEVMKNYLATNSAAMKTKTPTSGKNMQDLKDDIVMYLANTNITQPPPEISNLMDEIHKLL